MRAFTHIVRHTVRHGMTATTPVRLSTVWTRHYTVTTSGNKTPAQVDGLTTNAYHRLADEYLETLLDQLETLAEASPQLDAEYSQGVLTLELPPLGTYVINKQPPNKQIWISSPQSGPDRFDPLNDSWVSLRTGEKLGDVLRRELGEALEREVKLEGL